MHQFLDQSFQVPNCLQLEPRLQDPCRSSLSLPFVFPAEPQAAHQPARDEAPVCYQRWIASPPGPVHCSVGGTGEAQANPFNYKLSDVFPVSSNKEDAAGRTLLQFCLSSKYLHLSTFFLLFQVSRCVTKADPSVGAALSKTNPKSLEGPIISDASFLAV